MEAETSVSSIDGGFLFYRGFGGAQGNIHADSSILQMDAAGDSIFGLLKIVGDQEHQAFLGRFFEQSNHLEAVFSVQIACRFVGNENGSGLGKGTGDGKALLLTAGQLGRSAAAELPQFHLF